jgi:Flp pilus assembly pilin Flp
MEASAHDVKEGFLRLPFVRDRNGFVDQQGVTALEYALLMALIAMVIIVAAQALGENLFTKLLEVWQMIPK